MISRFPGTCAFCKQPTKAHVDIYDVDTKQNYHEQCKHAPDLFSQSEAEALATRLHFVSPSAMETVRWGS